MTSGTSREATRLSGWESPEVMGRVCGKVRREEVALEMKADLGRDSGRRDIDRVAKDLGGGPTLVESGEVDVPMVRILADCFPALFAWLIRYTWNR